MSTKHERAEMSAAKNVVLDVLDSARYDESRHDEDGWPDLVTLADTIVERLAAGGVLIPEWMPDPINGGRPAQGYYPTASQMEAWHGRAVTPVRVTGR